MRRVVVFGAGVTGLARAWKLRREGAEVTVLEPSARAGGAVMSRREGPYLVEAGPNTLLLNDGRVLEFLRELGLEGEMVEAAPVGKKRYLAMGGRPMPVPLSPGTFLGTPLLSWAGKLRLLGEPFQPARRGDGEESLGDFVRRRMGREALEAMVQPVVSGIYAGDPERLSVGHVFPKLVEWEQRGGSLLAGALRSKKSPHRIARRLVSLRGGLEQLPRAMADALGDSVKLGTRARSLRPAGDGTWEVEWDGGGARGELVVACPSWTVVELPWPEAVGRDLAPLRGVEHPPLVSATLAFARREVAHPLDGFGVLIPDREGLPLLGALFLSSLFPGRCPEDEVLLTCFLGGRLHPEYAGGDEETVMARVMGVLEGMLGVTGKPVWRGMTRWERSIPQPELGHGERLRAAEAVEAAHPGVAFIGGYRNGVSLTQCLMAGLGV